MNLIQLIIISAILLISQFAVVPAQDDTSWYWRRGDDPDSVWRTRAELDSLLRLHLAWAIDSTKESRRLSLKSAKLDGAYLEGVFLRAAKLDSACLWGAYLESVNLEGAFLCGTQLKGARLKNANLKGANLFNADLSNAIMENACLDSAYLKKARLDNARLSRARLNHARLPQAHLEGADLEDAQLKKADLWEAYVENAIFDGSSLPMISTLAQAHGLKKLKYDNDPSLLVELSNKFADKGYNQQERDIICALRRHNQSILSYIFFDLTSEYGSNLSQPWYLLGVIYIICSSLYYISMLKGSWSRIRLFLDAEKSMNIHIKNFQLKNFSSGYIRKVPMFLRLLWWAGFFSLMSAFNIGFRDINFGRWLRLLPRKEFDLKATGWIRTVSGFQALCSVYLIGLWVLSFAGTPFK